jgi:hypothetical protein
MGVWAYGRMGALGLDLGSTGVHRRVRPFASSLLRRHADTPLRPHVSPIDSLHGVTKMMAYV